MEMYRRSPFSTLFNRQKRQKPPPPTSPLDAGEHYLNLNEIPSSILDTLPHTILINANKSIITG